MPILYFLGIVLAGYVLYGIYLLVAVIFLPILLGWVTYVAYKLVVSKNIRKELWAKFADWVELEHSSDKLSIKVRDDLTVELPKDSDATMLLVGGIAAFGYLIYTYEILLKHISDKGLSRNVTTRQKRIYTTGSRRMG